jgi:hypothetical protein
MNEFKLDPDADTDGTYRRGKILIPPKRVVDTFGPPDEGDGYKVSGSYTFTDQSGNVFTLYDWKATSLFDDGAEPGEESSSPTPEEFWGNWNPDLLHIGGHDEGDVEAFKRWLLERIA